MKGNNGRDDGLELLLEEAGGVGSLALDDFLWCAGADDVTTFLATFRTNVDDVVGTLDDIHVVLNDENRVTTLNEGVEGMQQTLNVVEMKSCGWLVEDEKCFILFLQRDVIGKLDTLILTARKR